MSPGPPPGVVPQAPVMEGDLIQSLVPACAASWLFFRGHSSRDCASVTAAKKGSEEETLREAHRGGAGGPHHGCRGHQAPQCPHWEGREAGNEVPKASSSTPYLWDGEGTSLLPPPLHPSALCGVWGHHQLRVPCWLPCHPGFYRLAVTAWRSSAAPSLDTVPCISFQGRGTTCSCLAMSFLWCHLCLLPKCGPHGAGPCLPPGGGQAWDRQHPQCPLAEGTHPVSIQSLFPENNSHHLGVRSWFLRSSP